MEPFFLNFAESPVGVERDKTKLTCKFWRTIMGAKEFFTAIDMLDVYNDIVKQQQKPKPPVHLTTRELGRYRFYIYREKMLTRELERLCAEHLRLEKLMEKRGVTADISLKNSHKREKYRFLDLVYQHSLVRSRKRELEQKLDLISDPFVKTVVKHRYFEDTKRRLPTWAQTAKELDIPLTGVRLRAEITAALQ